MKTSTNPKYNYAIVTLTHNAGVAGADVCVLVLGRVAHGEVVGLLLELGPVQRPGLLARQLTLLRPPRPPPPPEGRAEHHRLLLTQET